MATKLKKIPLKTGKIKINTNDARVTKSITLLNQWFVDKTLSDDELLKGLGAAFEAKEVELGKTEIDFVWKEQLLGSLDVLPKDRNGQRRGLGPREIRKRNKIEDVIVESTDSVLLEPGDYEELKACVEGLEFTLRAHAIDDFTLAVENAEEVEVEVKEKERKI